MGKLLERFIDYFHYTPIKDGVRNASKDIILNDIIIEDLNKEIKLTERELFYLNSLKDHLLTDIEVLKSWKRELTDKLEEENEKNINEKK